MEELMIVANVAIVFGVIYKLFELFAGRRERMMLIEKMGDKLTPETFKNGIMYRPSLYSFGGLRIGCLLLGLGAGLLVGYVLTCTTQPDYLSDNYPYTVKRGRFYNLRSVRSVRRRFRPCHLLFDRERTVEEK